MVQHELGVICKKIVLLVICAYMYYLHPVSESPAAHIQVRYICDAMVEKMYL